ncbi:hypothetical protein [Rossellomorea yichunensis]|uniref:hypothetical protein n=1 Tax=Rossellomorea yichunensis TaxID=3077331 RepID=UPI0028E7E589|nr:hypothetical protein [Rossellomorea sp. YC4-1]
MYERRTIYRKNLMNLFNSGSGFPNLGTGYDGNPPGGYQGYVPWESNQFQGGGFGGGPGYYNQGPYGSTSGPQGFPPQGFPQPGYGPPPFGPAGGYGYGINPIGAGLIGLGLGFLGGQIVNTPFKGPHKRYYYYL